MPLEMDRQALPLSIERLGKGFGRSEVLKGVSLRLPQGAIYGLVGLNGAGKTTTLECALGLLGGWSGEIRVLGERPRDLHRLRGRLGAVFDAPCLNPHLTVRRVLEHARLLAGRRACDAADVERLLGLERYQTMKAGHLSLGNRRRTSIARALVGRPEVLILDEPFSGLDAGGVEDILALVLELNRREGTTFLLSSHQLHYLERISTHVGVLHEGRMVVEGRTAELLEGESPRIHVRADDAHRAAALLVETCNVRDVRVVSTGAVEGTLDGMDPGAVNRRLVEAGLVVSELVSRRPSLEALFRDITGGNP